MYSPFLCNQYRYIAPFFSLNATCGTNYSLRCWRIFEQVKAALFIFVSLSPP